MLMSKKYLTITSDDFGMCHAVNLGIVRAMQEGVVTSTTLMAPCPWFPEAVRLTKEHGLKVGVHLCLTCEWDQMRWGPITRAPSLCAPDGYFLTSYPDLIKSAHDEEVALEFDAQIARVRAAGIEPAHADVHMLSGDDSREGITRFQEHVRTACRRNDLVWIRDYQPGSGLVHLTDLAGSSGVPEKEFWLTMQGWTRPGFYHIIAHVAEDMPELKAICTEGHHAAPWSSDYRVADMRLLSSSATRARLEELGFTLVDSPTLLSLLPKGSPAGKL